MHDMGYIERLPAALWELSDTGRVKQFLEEKGMTAYTFLSSKRERVDVDVLAALRRDKEMSPGARLDWLAAAWEFAQMPKRKVKQKR